MTQDQPLVWFITGCSTGFGRELAQAVLAAGHKAAVTARDPKRVEDIVAAHPGRGIPLALEVTDPTQVRESVRRVEEHFGRIDVLVNNAGIGYFAAVEESDEREVRRMFEINFWGLAHMTDAVLPGMRKRRSGHIVNISSVGGLVGVPSVGYYNATKFAVEGLSEALAKEVAPLGIKVTIVEPSGFRTDWAGRSANETSTEIADYDQTAGAMRRMMRELSGKQAGDPGRAARAIIEAVTSSDPPLHLLLGRDAITWTQQKLDALNRDIERWQDVTLGADAPVPESRPTPVA